MYGSTFTLKSKISIGTEVIVTFPPERVMSALGPMSEDAPRPCNRQAHECQDDETLLPPATSRS